MIQGRDPIEAAFMALMVFIPMLFSLCFHEVAHGWIAKKRGDLTAQMMGRLTLNPMAHADPLGTFLLPLGMLFFGLPVFGWAKPVPVNEHNLKNPRIDMFWIAFAGPLSNFFLAAIASVFAAVTIVYLGALSYQQAIVNFLAVFIQINAFLAIFNMLPLHPLDGGKILARFLPEDINHKLEANQHISSWILLFLFMSGALSIVLSPMRNIGTVLIHFFVNLLV